MASMRDIKRRRNSIASTQQITKAMKLVSTVKLQKARTRAENSKPYFTCMYETVTSMLSKVGKIEHPYMKEGDSDKKGIVVITSNRGLAGGYNANVVRIIVDGGLAREKIRLYTVGRKGTEIFVRKGYEITEDYSDMIESLSYDDAREMTKRLLSDFLTGKIGEIYVAYTFFKNTVSHVPKLIKLLPVDEGAVQGAKTEEETVQSEEKVGQSDEKTAQLNGESDALTLMNFEPDEEQVLDLLVPKYVASILYGAMVEAAASENGARMQAMDSATNNAQEIMEDLALKYNRARQGSITQELTEIIAGAEALG